MPALSACKTDSRWVRSLLRYPRSGAANGCLTPRAVSFSVPSSGSDTAQGMQNGRRRWTGDVMISCARDAEASSVGASKRADQIEWQLDHRRRKRAAHHAERRHRARESIDARDKPSARSEPASGDGGSPAVDQHRGSLASVRRAFRARPAQRAEIREMNMVIVGRAITGTAAFV